MGGRKLRLVLAAPGRPYDLALVCTISTLAVMLSILGWRSPILDLLAFLSVFFLPGWALTSAIFPGKGSSKDSSNVSLDVGQISLLERFMASIILSLVLFAMGGISLAWSPVGFTSSFVLTEVLVLNIVLSAAAIFRRFMVPEEEEFELILELKLGRGAINNYDKSVLLLALAGLLVAILLSVGTLQKGIPPETYTEFYITGPDGSLGTLPQSLRVGENATVIITFVNHMREAEKYNLTLGVLEEDKFTDYSGLNWSTVHDLLPSKAFCADETVLDGQTFSRQFLFRFLEPGQHRLLFILQFDDQMHELWLIVDVV
ncbi:MAG: DUF1616 domain-containing protein [Methanomassiliicoccales archaeon]